MKYYNALEIVELLSEVYLFSGIVAYAEYQDSDINEEIMEMFSDINGIGISEVEIDNFHLDIYHSERLSNAELIAEYFNLLQEEVNFIPCKPFVFFGKKNRPLLIGSSISHIDSTNDGTLGCFVVDQNKQVFLLSNRHVLYNADADYKDDFIIQPGKLYGGGKSDSIAVLYDKLAFDYKDINEFDAALAGPISLDIASDIPEQQTIKGIISGTTGQKVYKSGATTGLSFGIVGSISASFKVTLNETVVAFKNQIVVNGFNGDYEIPDVFAKPGDSGSVVIEKSSASAIGLLFAGSKNGEIALCNPIDAILTKFGVAILNS